MTHSLLCVFVATTPPSLVGGSGGVGLNFLFPALFHWKLLKDDKRNPLTFWEVCTLTSTHTHIHTQTRTIYSFIGIKTPAAPECLCHCLQDKKDIKNVLGLTLTVWSWNTLAESGGLGYCYPEYRAGLSGDLVLRHEPHRSHAVSKSCMTWPLHPLHVVPGE